jgi:hypothetical protein
MFVTNQTTFIESNAVQTARRRTARSLLAARPVSRRRPAASNCGPARLRRCGPAARTSSLLLRRRSGSVSQSRIFPRLVSYLLRSWSTGSSTRNGSKMETSQRPPRSISAAFMPSGRAACTPDGVTVGQVVAVVVRWLDDHPHRWDERFVSLRYSPCMPSGPVNERSVRNMC